MNPTPGDLRPNPPTVDARHLWTGGAATAVVAGLVAAVGILIFDGALHLGMVAPPLLPLGSSFAVRYGVTSGLLALLATGVAHLLVVTTPRPRAFFQWIVGLVTAVGVALPFTLAGTFGGQLATAIVDLVIGLSIGSLLSMVLGRTVSPQV